MPRKARVKSPEFIYHVICRSISEVFLFRDDEDKDYYINLLKRYMDKYKCSLYGYCLMDNHLHLHLDPKGFDISKFMHSLNTAYVWYYNKKYGRHGHVFEDRFESRVLDTEGYNLNVSAYIHNNAQNLEGYSGKEEEYPYSSYGIYLGLRKDFRELVDKSFMMGLFNITDVKEFAGRYCEFVSHQRDVGGLKEVSKNLSSAVENEYISGREVILRECSPSKIISFISGRLLADKKIDILTKAKQRLMEYRAFTAYSLRALCGLGYKDICGSMFNMTISGCSRLCDRGYELVKEDLQYRLLFDELMTCKI